VSLDDDASHARFASQHRLPYPLLRDPDGRIARLNGAMGGLQGCSGWRSG
jgi:peroxiredoxin Q/BCP